MDKMQLPYTTQTPFQAFSTLGFFTGILQAQGHCFDGILANRNKHIVFYREDIFLQNYGYIRDNAFERTDLKIPLDNILPYLKQCILRGYYIDLYLNERFIKNQRAFQSHNFKHEYMIFGFDNETQTFDVAGYYGTTKRTLRVEQIPYDMMEQAIRTMPEATHTLPDVEFAYLYRVKEGYRDERIRKRMVKWQIWAYLHPILSFWDIAVYDLYIEHTSSKKRDHIDSRTLRFFYEAKYATWLALRLCESEFADEYEEKVTKHAHALLYLAIKYNLTKNEKLVDRFCERVKTIKEDEQRILKQFLREHIR